VKLPLNDHVKQLLDKTHALDIPHQRQYLAHEAFHNLILPTIQGLLVLNHLHEIGTPSVTSMSSGNSISPESSLGKRVSRKLFSFIHSKSMFKILLCIFSIIS